jgi:transposase
MSGKRRKYTPEFREQAARLVIETGRPAAHVAAEIGVGEQLLGRWVRRAREAAAAGDTGAVLDADERAELERLRRENAELRLDCEFLKKLPWSLMASTRWDENRGGGWVALHRGGADAGRGVCRA